jgi:hypothetical protein
MFGSRAQKRLNAVDRVPAAVNRLSRKGSLMQLCDGWFSETIPDIELSR